MLSGYMYRNPYEHLTKVWQLTAEEWTRIRDRLTLIQLMNIENGGVEKVGAAARVWKIEPVKWPSEDLEMAWRDGYTVLHQGEMAGMEAEEGR